MYIEWIQKKNGVFQILYEIVLAFSSILKITTNILKQYLLLLLPKSILGTFILYNNRDASKRHKNR